MIDYQTFYQSSLTSNISDTDLNIPLDDVPIPSEGFLVIEPEVEAKREAIYFTSKDGVSVTVPSGAGNGRGYDGTTAVSHLQGANVIMAPIGMMFKKFGNIEVDEITINSTANSEGWSPLGATPNTVTANGNRSYDLVFNSNDLTDTLSPGMRVKATRTVTAPTQCADLEASSSHYFNKTSPAGLSFTTTFTCAAWIKLESYTRGGIIARRNADTEGWSMHVGSDGRITLTGLRIASNKKEIASYQSIPLNKWVHVAATMDMAAADTTAQKIWIDGVEVPRAYTLTGTATAIVQGTTALVVGAEKSAGTNPFDGKIAQAAVFSSQLPDATVKAMATQTLTGSETNLVSAFSLNNTLNDLNTGNANNLTAQNSAVATATDTPFAGGSVGTTEYGIVTAATFSTNTTLTVQVPEGYALPTTGGVSAVSYSISKIPYGFPVQQDKWTITSVLGASSSQSSPTNGTWYNLGGSLLVPAGSWGVDYTSKLQVVSSAQTFLAAFATLGTSASTADDETTRESTQMNSSLTQVDSLVTAYKVYNPTSATTYYLNAKRGNGAGGQLLMTVVTKITALLTYL